MYPNSNHLTNSENIQQQQQQQQQYQQYNMMQPSYEAYEQYCQQYYQQCHQYYPYGQQTPPNPYYYHQQYDPSYQQYTGQSPVTNGINSHSPENATTVTNTTKMNSSKSMNSSSREKPNKLQVWRNQRTMNLPQILYSNILTSNYFKSLFDQKTYNEVIREITSSVKQLEPWSSGSQESPSTAFCLLYKLFTLKLTRRQLEGMSKADNPFVKAIAFLYIRFAVQPEEMMNFFSPHLDNLQEFQYKYGQKISISEFICSLLKDQKYMGIVMLPRLPLTIAKEFEKKAIETEKKHGFHLKSKDHVKRKRENYGSSGNSEDKDCSGDDNDDSGSHLGGERKRRRGKEGKSVTETKEAPPSLASQNEQSEEEERPSSPVENKFSQRAPVEHMTAQKREKIREKYLQGSASSYKATYRTTESSTIQLGKRNSKLDYE